ncbi:MAG: tetratricopeptide repeat protein [Deltaproteobacteria bacterium]|nr:tetratricopeptide repeat protein [Deltaproteobacteria bacterium]
MVAHKYMPEEMSVEELRATFAARQDILDLLVNAIRDQTRTKTLSNYLITGPRGTGKTTIVLMTCLRIREDAELNCAWIPVRFPEELRGVVSLRDLLSRTLERLAMDGVSGAASQHKKVEDEDDEETSESLALAALQRITAGEGKRLILLLENLDQILEESFDNKAKSRFRRLLMDRPFMMIVGTAVRAVGAFEKYESTFFNFFHPISLERLNDAQVYELMKLRADYEGNSDFENQYAEQKAKIRALALITGGNPRLLLMVYEILTQGNFNSTVNALYRLVDELTPLLKDVLEHQLSVQQKQVIDALMRTGGIATPAEIAQQSRLPLNSVTSQLQRLKDMQIVELHNGGKGQRDYYGIPDQLFSTWYQMRYLRKQRRRIEIFVDVLKIWFEEEQRLATVHSLAEQAARLSGGEVRDSAIAAEYFMASLTKTPYEFEARDAVVNLWLKKGFLDEAAMFLAELRDIDSTAHDNATAYAELRDWALEHGNLATAVRAAQVATEQNPNDYYIRIRYGLALSLSGNQEEALRIFNELVESNPQNVEILTEALMNRGTSRRFQGDAFGAASDYTAVIDLPNAQPAHVAQCLIYRGTLKAEARDLYSAIDDYTKAIGLPGAPSECVARALCYRGVWKGQLDDRTGEIADYTATIELEGATAEQVAEALMCRGVRKGQLGDRIGEIEDYTSVIEREGTHPEQIAQAFTNRGVAKNEYGDIAGAIQDYTKAIEVKDAGSRYVAQALYNRAARKGLLGDFSGAIADYSTVIKLDGAPISIVTQALTNRGIIKSVVGKPSEAKADFVAVIEREDVPPVQLAQAIINYGVTLGWAGDTAEAIENYNRAIELTGVPPEFVAQALYNRGVTKALTGDTEGSIADYTGVIEKKESTKETLASALFARGTLRLRLGNRETAIADLLDCVRSPAAFGWYRARALRRVCEVVRDDKNMLEAVLKAATEGIAEVPEELRFAHIISIAQTLTVPELRNTWARVMCAVIAAQPRELAERLEGIKTAAEVIKSGDTTWIDRLPSVQRAFVKELIKRFAGPTSLVGSRYRYGKKKSKKSKNKKRSKKKRP